MMMQHGEHLCRVVPYEGRDALFLFQFVEVFRVTRDTYKHQSTSPVVHQSTGVKDHDREP